MIAPKTVVLERAAPSTVTVDPAAIAANTARMASIAAVPVMAVVKADGFGLGAATMARAALVGGARELGVATCDEALALRAAGIEVPILAWLLHPGSPLDEALVADIALSCASTDQLAAVARAAGRTGRRAIVELEVETGMHRSGAAVEEWDALLRAAVAARDDGLIELRGVWTHLGSTSGDVEAFAAPLRRLGSAHALAARHGLRGLRRHAASSLATVAAGALGGDVVRLGASLLGIEPLPHRPVGLSAVVRWHTHAVQVHRVRAGETVGYGGGFRAERDGVIALLPVGYADGVPRAAWPGVSVSVRGRRAPVVGAVSMDQCVIAAPHDAAVGDTVVLLGVDPGQPTLAEWAQKTGTIAQEVLTRLGPRVARETGQEQG